MSNRPVCPVCGRRVRPSDSFTVLFGTMTYLHARCYDALVDQHGSEAAAESAIIRKES